MLCPNCKHVNSLHYKELLLGRMYMLHLRRCEKCQEKFKIKFSLKFFLMRMLIVTVLICALCLIFKNIFQNDLHTFISSCLIASLLTMPLDLKHLRNNKNTVLIKKK